MLESVQKKYTTKIETLKDFITVTFVLVSDLYEKYTPQRSVIEKVWNG